MPPKTRWTRRERLIKQARKMGLRFSPSISDNELQNLINDQPATPRQIEFIEKLLRRHDRTCPPGLTYGQARQALALANEQNNQYAIDALKLQEGACIEWEGKHYLVQNLLGAQRLYQVVLREVQLSRPSDTEKAVTTPVSDTGQVVHPHELLYLCHVVDLTMWPQENYWPAPENEPDF